ncbi:hypothetical protein QNI19_18290 [Cytophagaceae bacterium DM2B3-1]|uniref:Uncharacterized protein n=1 Tax=Xanthocytophaga flava TaxID=3048013 RepID=A0ABT7CMC1_9BACT|nr:hypothetical protein [Xanthocytophaga flavus]MDJ1467383.1 hypothetical protein [Xanthocytophaga flavus]MDJ1494894.1 hypothetical protein [Xanthocytophaga flavus]
MRVYPPESFGYKIAQVLDTYNFTLIPHYESHDAKHILLDYEMTAEGEVQLQCFMLGNGQVIFSVIFAVCLGFILMPDQWCVFYNDILRGYRTSTNISAIDFCQLLPNDLKSVQKELLYSTQTN